MEQAEQVELFRKFYAARAEARVETNPDYDASAAVLVGSSGTLAVASSPESESVQEAYWSEYSEAPEVTATATFELAPTYVVSVGASAGSDMIFGEVLAEYVRRGYPDHDITPVSLLYGTVRISGNALVRFRAKAGKGTGVTIVSGRLTDVVGAEGDADSDVLDEVVDQARRNNLHHIGDRLAELGREPLEEDEEPLSAAAAKYFVEYFLRRRNETFPLITATYTGELEATWNGPEQQVLAMRFFPNGSVSVAYRLAVEKGSFIIAASDLLSPLTSFRIPDWA